MKALQYMSLILLLLLQTACKNDDDNTPGDPLDALPEATTIGANTFGCLLDGEIYLPGNAFNPLDSFYQFVDGDYFFAVRSAKRDGDNNLIGIAIGTSTIQLNEGNTYIIRENSPGNASAIYTFNSFNIETSSTDRGELIITKLDEENQIISGTFWFDVVDQEGVLHQIREGRFDMEYVR